MKKLINEFLKMIDVAIMATWKAMCVSSAICFLGSCLELVATTLQLLPGLKSLVWPEKIAMKITVFGFAGTLVGSVVLCLLGVVNIFTTESIKCFRILRPRRQVHNCFA